jgi:hypothetical protein
MRCEDYWRGELDDNDDGGVYIYMASRIPSTVKIQGPCLTTISRASHDQHESSRHHRHHDPRRKETSRTSSLMEDRLDT